MSAGLAIALLAGSTTIAQTDTALPGFPYWPALTLTDRGPHGIWTIGSTVTLRWRQRGLLGERVRIEVSRDRGRTWRGIGFASATAREFSWNVLGKDGQALVRAAVAGSAMCSTARRVRFVEPAVSVTYATLFGSALHRDGRVRVWGYLPLGALPHGVRAARQPRQIRGFPPLRSVSAGGSHLVGIDAEGHAWLWGQPGGNTLPPAPVFDVPQMIEGVDDCIWARASGGKTLLRTADGRVFGVSHDGTSVLFDGETATIGSPIELVALRGAIDVRFGQAHGLALMPDGDVLSFGSNFLGALGDPDRGAESGPLPVPGVSGALEIAALVDTSMALRENGDVLVWGGAQGLLGAELSQSISYVPFTVNELPPARHIACGDGFGVALTEDGELYAWGSNASGELGDGTTQARITPVRVPLPPVVACFAGYGNVQVLTQDGDRYAWGSAAYYTVGDGGSANRLMPVEVVSR